jgi:hypothetical protein
MRTLLARYILAALISSATVLVAPAARPHVHTSPDGTVVDWYPKDCCSDGDCRPVDKVVRASQGVWLTTTEGFTVLVGPKDRRLPSHDARWHVCINPMAEPPTESVTCIFEPSNS